MIKTQGIRYILISSIVQLISILLAHWVIYSVVSNFHKSYVSIDGGEGMGYMLTYLIWFVFFSVLLTTIIQEIFRNEFVISSIHVLWILFIIWDTSEELEYRPYNYGLILFCISLSLPVRILLRKFIHIQQK